MKLFSKCKSCKTRKLFVYKAEFKAKHIGIIKGREYLCFKCNRHIHKLIK